MIKAFGALAAALGSAAFAAAPAGPALAAPAGPAAAAAPAEIADGPELDEAAYKDLVTDAQRLLRLRGFDPGPVDGQLGLRTRRAIRAYQAEAHSHGVLEALKGPAGPAQADPLAPPELVRTNASGAASD